MRMRKLVVLFAPLSVALALQADTLVLRDGQKFIGTFLGGNTRQIEFLPDSGNPAKIPVDSIESLTFTQHMAAAAPSSAPKSASRVAVVVPSGTAFRVRTIDLIDVDTTQAGAHFRGTIDDPVMLGGEVIVPRGADAVLVAHKVRQGGKFKGSDVIELKVDSITVKGRAYPVVTSLSETKSAGEGKKTAGKIVGGAGLGAIIGGIAGGGTGAAIGALVGGAGGTVVAASGQPHLKIPAETRLDFQLLADWKVR